MYKKFLTSKDKYLIFTKKFNSFTSNNESLEKEVELLKTNIRCLAFKVDCQLFLGFEIMQDAINELMSDFSLKKLDELAVMKATHRA